MELLPAMMAEQPPEVRRQDDERDRVKGDRTEGVLERLRRRPDRHENIEKPEPCGGRKQQDERMCESGREADIAQPVVKREQLQTTTRPCRVCLLLLRFDGQFDSAANRQEASCGRADV